MAEGAGWDAIVVGGGPNGLAAAIALARTGHSVQLVEGEATVGGGCRSGELTLPGFIHDLCSAVHPLGRSSPFFSQLPLERHGLRWIEPPVQLAHPLDDGAALLLRDLDATARRLGPDAGAYLDLVSPVVRRWDLIIGELTGPFRVPLDPRKLVAAARFGLHAIQPLTALAQRFKTPAARALLAGCGAHSMLGLSELLTGGFGLIFLASGHTVGWPIPAGGSQRIADALAGHLKELGGTIVTSRPVGSIDELPPSRAVLLDITPRQVLEIAGGRLASWRGSGRYLRQLRRFRYGPGAFKLDLALDGPIPWRDPEVLRSATVDVGGTFRGDRSRGGGRGAGQVPERPFVLLAQSSLSTHREPPRDATPPRRTVASRTAPRGHDRENPGPGSNASPPDFAGAILAMFAPGAGRPRAVQPELHRRRYRRRRTNISSSITRPAWRAGPVSARRTRASSSARHRRRPAPACMASAGGYAARSALRKALGRGPGRAGRNG